MVFHQQSIDLTTAKPLEIIDVTSQITACVKKSNFKNGLLTLVSLHTTMSLVLNEKCEKLQDDMIAFLNRLVPPTHENYKHNEGTVDGRPNAHSHLLALFLPTQLTVVVKNNALDLGAWQSIFAVELDGPRPQRKIQLTFLGE